MEYDDRPLITQYLEPRRRQKSAQKIAEQESRKRAKARGARGYTWSGFLKPFLLSLAAIVAFLLAMGLGNAVLTGHS